MTPETLLSILNATPGWAEQAAASDLDDTATLHVLSEAAKFARTQLEPLAARADVEGCRIEEGRVKTPAGYAETFRRMGEDGWIAPDLAPDLGGMGLPLALHVTASSQMEGAALPFMMALGSTRAAAHCLAATAPELATQWSPKLADGTWAATICISEPDAGSDVGRIRTRATADGDAYRISGTKCWISFGDHDMAERIGHLCLARTGTVEDGTRGLSLFLIEGGPENGTHVERIEEKLGLHGSPTCVVRFDAAKGTLIGTEGRGLPALFNMIELMRLQVGTQGAGIAATTATLARSYAEDRKQGGHPAQPPVAIIHHPDVQRQLMMMDARTHILAALLVETAVTLQQAQAGDPQARTLAPFLLPMAKTFGGELGQANADAAIQVLGGAGYTREWPAERHFRDARIMTIYEGTTGMQAQDILFRRLLKSPDTMNAIVFRYGTSPLFDRIQTLIERLATAAHSQQALAADAMLRACWCATADLLAQRIADHSGAAQALTLWRALAPSDMAQAEATVDLALST
ncbi:acyl-CoA dehydrogenase family protein [Sagittula sp. NFXS13]|uniref:acyl-CoA dehydrogenase family protein n=1 Tax=Sagittula sp. NFXS13 TaxID=2819095 RepID=UPI0032DFDD8B